MRGAERGFLLLTSHLGDPESKPLTVAQFRKLATLVRGMEKPKENRELTLSDLQALGYGKEMAQRILELLARQELLEYYVNLAARTDCYPITRIGPLYPQIWLQKLGLDSPGCLWAKGDSTLLSRPAIALVGSRDLEDDNAAFAAEVGRQAALQGFVLISGNARGADRLAQESCLASGGQVVSIVADSLEKCPDTPGVLYLSEDGFNMPFSAARALSRNRLVHSMAVATLVAQSGNGTGGTWNGSILNLRHHWSPLYCFRNGGEGTAALVQMGAGEIGVEELADLSGLAQQEISLFDQ